MLVETDGHTVPHFKAPVYAKVELWGLEPGGIFSIQTSLLDIKHLLHKTGFVKTESVGTVILRFMSLGAVHILRKGKGVGGWYDPV